MVVFLIIKKIIRKIQNYMTETIIFKKIYIERDRTRTCNPQIRSLVPYPLGHTPFLILLIIKN